MRRISASVLTTALALSPAILAARPSSATGAGSARLNISVHAADWPIMKTYAVHITGPNRFDRTMTLNYAGAVLNGLTPGAYRVSIETVAAAKTVIISGGATARAVLDLGPEVRTRFSGDQSAVDQFLANPSKWLAQYPNGGAQSISLLRDVVIAHPEALQSVISLLGSASTDQQSAIGSALGQAATIVKDTDQAFASQIQQAVAATTSDAAKTAYASATGDVSIGSAAGGGGGGGGGGGIGGAIGGGAGGGGGSFGGLGGLLVGAGAGLTAASLSNSVASPSR
jgi:hypothetical protein